MNGAAATVDRITVGKGFSSLSYPLFVSFIFTLLLPPSLPPLPYPMPQLYSHT